MKNQVKNVLKLVLWLTGLKDIARNLRSKYNVYITRKKLIRREYQRDVFVKPRVINLNANDICNSKCVMCDIWEQKKEFELTPDQFESLLRDDLYSEIAHVGITGGEPTLREDLHLIYESVIKAIPNVRGLSIITNAIREEDVIERIDKVREVCRQYGKAFSMMVSLDGYKETHDKVRGREGNFQSAIKVIRYFKERNVEIAIGCTISKINVWEVEEQLHFMKKEKIYGRFRVAEFIQRLYNLDKGDVIKNFSDDEKYFLTLFFYKLIFTFEKNETYKRTYYSIIEMLNGKPRQIGCPYQSEGVNLNSRGEMAYCAPKSPIVGSALATSSLKLYRDNMTLRNDIYEKECSSCIHDYHYPLTLGEFDKYQDRLYWRRKINLTNKSVIRSRNKSSSSFKSINKFSAFIVGWYGTETVGDKAILAGIIMDLQSKYNNEVDIVIASLFPYITHKTVKELAIKAKVVDVYSNDFAVYAQNSSVTIMGGGPLMDLEVLSVPLHAFRVAKKANKERIIYGCGLGPLTYQKNIDAVKEILSLSTQIMLRDNGSILFANKLGYLNATLSGDYAKYYLENKYSTEDTRSNNGILSCYLREWTHEYSKNVDYNAFLRKKIAFELALADFIKSKAREIGAKEIRLQHMHNFVIGNDDRDFSRYFIEQYFNDYSECRVTYDKSLSTVDSIVDQMKCSELNICMRFHSVLFAHTLNTDFFAIDYTLGGKIYNYLEDNNCIDRLISVDELVTVE